MRVIVCVKLGKKRQGCHDIFRKGIVNGHKLQLFLSTTRRNDLVKKKSERYSLKDTVSCMFGICPNITLMAVFSVWSILIQKIMQKVL